MTNDKLIEDRAVHAAIRAMFQLVRPRLNDRKLEKLDDTVAEIYDIAGIELEWCRECQNDYVKNDMCAHCTPPATRS